MKRMMISGLVLFAAALLLVAWSPGKPAAKQGKRQVTLPAHAVAVVPGKLFWLGTAVENGRLVEGYAIIHRKKGFGKPTGCNNDGKCQGWEDASCGDCSGAEPPVPDSTCYEFLAKGAKWKIVEDYIVDPANEPGLTGTFISENLAADIDKWEDAADGMMDDGYFLNIIGDEIDGTVDGADMVKPDKKNEVYFADIETPNAIAITVVWGIFRGPPKNRELVEWDQVYDDQDWGWSEDCTQGCTTEMDFENIATHELGHTFGLADLYTAECAAETMYGYASSGDTDKRSLEAGDITGISELYQ